MKLSMMSMVMMQVDHFSAEETVELARELRLDGIDWVTCHRRDPAELRRLTDAAGVPCVAYTFWANELPAPDVTTRQRGLETLRRNIDIAHVLGAPVLMIPTPGVQDVPRDVLRRRWITGLEAALPLTRAAGLTLTIENYPGADSPFVLAADLREALAALPELGVTFDNGNAASGESAVASFRAVADRTAHAHFKDWETSEVETPDCPIRMLDGRYYGRALISEGRLSREGVHPACLQAMKDAGYAGCINIEYEATRYRADDAIRRAVRYLRECAARLT